MVKYYFEFQDYLNSGIRSDFDLIFMLIIQHNSQIVLTVSHEMSRFLKNLLIVSSSGSFPGF